MNEAAARPPVTLILSGLFLVVAVIGYIPIMNLSRDPVDGMGALGQGLGSVGILILLGIPGAFLSIIFGLLALIKTKWAFVTAAPALLTLISYVSLLTK